MKKPTNQKAEILLELIERKKISRLEIMKYCGIANPTAVISQLRKILYPLGCVIDFVPRKTTNKHGRKIQYAEWRLSNKPEARKIYQKINAK